MTSLNFFPGCLHVYLTSPHWCLKGISDLTCPTPTPGSPSTNLLPGQPSFFEEMSTLFSAWATNLGFTLNSFGRCFYSKYIQDPTLLSVTTTLEVTVISLLDYCKGVLTGPLLLTWLMSICCVRGPLKMEVRPVPPVPETSAGVPCH